jgi:hypothetical protein
MAAALLCAMLSLQGAALGAPVGVGSTHPGRTHGSAPTATITAYCLAGQRTTSGKRVYPGCLALSRPLARRLGLKSGRGTYDYRFGTRIMVEGVGCFVFDDLMPPKWQKPRVDIHCHTMRECREFGVKRARVWIVQSSKFKVQSLGG